MSQESNSPMSLDHAILGFLNYLPLSGYDLKKRFDSSIKYFWSAEQSQIYRTLGRLTGQGWVTVEVVEQSERPDRKVYHITDAGRAELHRWLGQPFPALETRSAALVQVFFGGQLSNAELLAKFQQFAAQQRQRLEQYRRTTELIARYAREIGSEREAFCWSLTLELGLQSMQAQLDWAEGVIERIEKNEIPA